MNVLGQKNTSFFIVDAFANKPFAGNPAGVVLNAESMTAEQMLRITQELNLMETGFVMNTDERNVFRIRYFTVEEEVEMCGHAAIATLTTLWKLGKIQATGTEATVYQDTKAGHLAVQLFELDQKKPVVVIGLPLPKWLNEDVPVKPVAEVLGINPKRITQVGLPLEIVNTGTSNLLVPIPDRETLFAIQPDFDKMKAFCDEMECLDFHVFTQETVQGDADIHCRNIFPFGQREESATGTANGAMSCYLVKHRVFQPEQGQVSLNIEQGYCMNRPSQIRTIIQVNDKMNITNVQVGGQAVIVAEGKMVVESS